MSNDKHRLREGQRVKLKKDGQDGPYPWAAAGAEGWVKGLDIDKVGFPMVYIKWDRDHWTFNGEEDQWTFEDHFEPVEEDMTDKSKEELFAEFIEWQKNQGGSAPSSDSDSSERFAEELARAKEFATKADAFLLIAVEIDKSSGQPMYTPGVFNYYKDNAAGLLLESQLGILAAGAYQNLTLAEIKRRGKES